MVGLYVDGGSKCKGNTGVWKLDAKDTEEISIHYKWPDRKKHTLEIVADIEVWHDGEEDDMIKESNELNNAKSIVKTYNKDSSKESNKGQVLHEILHKLLFTFPFLEQLRVLHVLLLDLSPRVLFAQIF